MSEKRGMLDRGELRRRARDAENRMRHLFTLPKYKLFSGRKRIGLKRIKEQLAFALLIEKHMKKRKIRSIQKLADFLYIGNDEHFETLTWIRNPCAFSRRGTQKQYDDFLIALCDMSWNPQTRSFEIHNEWHR